MNAPTHMSRTQIESQLERMLRSKTFTGGIRVAPEKSVQLFSHIVNLTLAGDSITERVLLLTFYGYSADQIVGTIADIDVARIGVLRLRKRLNDYYETEGVDDPVRIDIPKGQYKAVFSTNESSRAGKQLQLGFILLEQGDADDAWDYFEQALKLEPELADAWAGIASARIALLYHAHHDNKDAFDVAEKACEKALALDQNCWRAHAELGAICLFHHEWDNADRAFRKAKQIAPLKILELASYATFLVSRGYNDDARDLATYLNAQFDRPHLQIRAAHIFYGLGECETADEILGDIRARNLNLWQLYWLRAWVHLQMGEYPWEQISNLNKFRSAEDHPALQIFCHEAAGEHERSKALFEVMRSCVELSALTGDLGNGGFPSTVEYALGCLAIGDEEQAVEYLSKACDISAPFTAWLHVDPILNPLRRHRRFRELLRHWNYPPTSSTGGRLGLT